MIGELLLKEDAKSDVFSGMDDDIDELHTRHLKANKKIILKFVKAVLLTVFRGILCERH